MEIFIHRAGDAKAELIEVDETLVVREAVTPSADEGVWREDEEVELDANISVRDAQIPDRGHVHVHKCRKVAVDVRFNDDEKHHEFTPATTIHHVFQWATGPKGFALSEVDRAEHILQVCDTTTRPEPRDHVGSFTSPDSCAVCFSLVPKHRFEG